MTDRPPRGAHAAAVAYDRLARALAEAAPPPCTGDDRFILDAGDLAPEEVTHLARTVCHACPLLALCRAYGETARPKQASGADAHSSATHGRKHNRKEATPA